MTHTALMVHPSTELYGSDRMFAESVTALCERGWRVVVALPGDGPLADVLRSAGARVVRCPTPVLRKAALRPAGFARLLLEFVRAVPPTVRLLQRERPDLVFVSTVTVPLWLVLARLLRRRVLADVHEAEDEVPRAVRAALAAPLLTAHLVVVNSAATRSSLCAALPRLEHAVRLVYNGVAGPAMPPDRPAAPGSPPLLVLVGRLSPRKGTDLAVRAVELLHADGLPVRLDLIGDAFSGYEWYVDELRAHIAAAGLVHHVRLCGFQPDVWQAYGRADIALVPSRAEPFGNAAVEAQLAGVPVIVSEVQGLPETVGGGEHGVVVPTDDPRAIADAVVRLLDSWPAARTRALAAREVACERFAPARYRAELARICAELARTPRGTLSPK